MGVHQLFEPDDIRRRALGFQVGVVEGIFQAAEFQQGDIRPTEFPMLAATQASWQLKEAARVLP